MSTKVLVVGDIHNKHQKAEKVMSGWSGPIIQLGDIFDDFYDTVSDITETALWLKQSLQKPNRIHLMGNHDFHYMLPISSGVFCSGYTPEKHNAIKEILTQEDWNKLLYFYNVDNFWFSHAGVTKQWFQHPIKGVNVEIIKDTLNTAVQAVQARDYSNIHCIYAADRYRGGRFQKGGILWNDWRNMDVFDGVTQVVGHTPREKVTRVEYHKKMSVNINIDTHLRQVIILDTADGTYEILDC